MKQYGIINETEQQLTVTFGENTEDYISVETLRSLVKNMDLEFIPSQNRICFPIIQRIYYKMKNGVHFNDITVADGIIINGHHRYICSKLSKKGIGIKEGESNLNQLTYKWPEVEIDTKEWESIHDIRQHNLNDSISSGVDIDLLNKIVGL